MVANTSFLLTMSSMSDTTEHDTQPVPERTRPLRMFATVTAAALFSAAAVITLGPVLFSDRLTASSMAACAEPNIDTCIAAAAIAIAEQDDPAAGLQAVRALLDTRPEVRGNCHSIAHTVGREFGERFGDKAIVAGHTWCLWGYYHGLMQRHTTDDLHELVPYAQRLCLAVEKVLTVECMHGVGHAAYSTLKEIAPAAAVCEALTGKFAETCVDAVIMEEMNLNPDGRITSGFTTSDCLAFTNEDVIAGCARGMTFEIVYSGLSLTAGCGVFTGGAYYNCVYGYGGALAVQRMNERGVVPPLLQEQLEQCAAELECATGYGWSVYSYTVNESAAKAACTDVFRGAARDSCIKEVGNASDIEALE